MRYYFQRPPVSRAQVMRLVENETEQSVTVEVFRIKYDGPDMVKVPSGRRKLSIPGIFVPNYYTLVPVRNSRVTAPVDMAKCLEKGETKKMLENANRFGGYACALIFGDQPRLENTSIVGFYDFGLPEDMVTNQDKYMTFHDMLLCAVDNPVKAKTERAILERSVSHRTFLTGLENQLDMLSEITFGLLNAVGEISPASLNSLRELPLQQYFRAVRQPDGDGPGAPERNIDALRRFKRLRRKEQNLLRDLLC